MKNPLFKAFAAALVGMAFAAGTASALPYIVGDIDFTGTAHHRNSTMTSSGPGLADRVRSMTMTVDDASGDFSSILDGTPITSFLTNSNPYFLNTTTPYTFASVGGFTFTIYTSSIIAQSSTAPFGFVNVFGTGIVTSAGYENTPFTFTYQSQRVGNTTNPYPSGFTITTASVPDGGTTAALLGGVILLMVFAHGRLMARRA